MRAPRAEVRAVVGRALRSTGIAGALAVIAMGAACDRVPLTWNPPPPPGIDTPAGFARLWGTNCAGCHGANGDLGPARPMRDPLYLASVSDAELTSAIAEGSPAGTLMPAFAQHLGGALSPPEIEAIVSGMRRAWGAPSAKPSPIPYSAPITAGQPARGAAIFARSCTSCHAEGEVTDPFYLQLVSDQALRSAIIFGRPDLGKPGAAGPFPGRPSDEALTPPDVDDLVAWLAQQRRENWPPAGIRRGGRP
ncbi:MAG: c-type cytochrome [Phycisphaeraceae bacterium]|nr:c-type cytochrome [Phycisphaeraceae bacterium]